MGGKQKQAQRTKGNVRPSSSARAAEMLAASGSMSTGFVGFGALSGDLGYVPTTQGIEEADATVDSDFRMLLRKLSKRDAITKLKTLQEVTALCKEKSPDDVKSVLPYWPRVYNKLSVDVDRRVREATQQAMEQLVLRVRRNLAPHLKSLMGHWLIAHNDSYAPAASAARAAFQAAFPPAKQIEALVFCKQEIMNHISDNLLVQTAATLSDPKSTEPEDMESKYQRILAASLLTWRHFMSIIPIEQQQDVGQLYISMLQDGKLWKLAKHKTPAVRGAFYSMLASLCQTNPEIANTFGDKVCPTVLHSLDESEPAVSAPLWEAVLYTITTIEGCWNKVNVRKAVLPKLWLLLRAGGNGSAGAIYPNLLPLLSRIPSNIIGEGTAFYEEFFGNIQSGLMNERVTVSPSETAAIMGALMECLRFCLHQYLDETEENKIIQNFFIQDQLLTLLEASFVDSSSHLASSPLYSLMVNLLLSLESSQVSGDDGETTSEQRKKLLSILWGAIHEMCCRHIETAEPDNSHTLQRIGDFLQTFKEPPQKKKKKVPTATLR